MRNLRKRLGFGFEGGGGGGGGAGGGTDVSVSDGAFGAMGPSSRFAVGGIDVGGAVWTLPPGGCGGIRGTCCGGTIASELGVAGEVVVACEAAVAEVGGIGPGAGGVGPFAVWLCEPGKTMASESCILALGWVSGFFVSANVLCSCQRGHHLAVLLALT